MAERSSLTLVKSDYFILMKKLLLISEPNFGFSIIFLLTYLFSDDDMLGKYLFGCKYNLEETKIRLNNVYTLRSRYTNLFGDRDPCSSEHRVTRKAL